MKLLAPCSVFAEGLAFGLRTVPKGFVFPAARDGGQYHLSTNSLGGMIQ